MTTIKPVSMINDEALYDVKSFALLTGRDMQTIYSFIKRGTDIRKLKTRTYGGKTFILASEFEFFPFTGRGPNSKHRVAHFDPKTGEEKPCEACSAAGADTHE